MKRFLSAHSLKRLSLLVFLALFAFTIQTAFADGGSISFTESEYTVPVGWNGKTITPVTEGINSWLRYEYRSDDTGIAVVENSGYVRGVTGGTTIIHCKGINPTTNEEYEASYTLTVTIPVASLSVEQPSITLGVADTPKKDMQPELIDFFYHTPNVIVLPEDASNKTLEWTSSNEQVATVDKNGEITAVSPGLAVITGKVTDGGWASVQINVNVPTNFVSATTIHITDKEPVLFGCFARSGSGQAVGVEVTTSGVRHVNDRWDFGTTGDCFKLEIAKGFNKKTDRYSTDAELTWYYVVPTKAGQGTIRYILNGSTVFSVSVTVDQTAVE